MKLNCGERCLQVTLITVNILFWLCGCCILGVGIWMAVDETAVDDIDTDGPLWKGAVYTMISVGALIFVLGFLGWVGACCLADCLLLSYCISTGLILVLEIICATLALVYRDSLNAGVEEQMYRDLVTKYTTVGDTNNEYVTMWNKLQSQMECCGSYNFTDWHDNPNYPATSQFPIPWTCCKMSVVSDPPAYEAVINPSECFSEGRRTSANDQLSFQYAHNIGCHEALVAWISDQSALIYGVLFGCMAIQVVGIMFAGLLLQAIG